MKSFIIILLIIIVILGIAGLYSFGKNYKRNATVGEIQVPANGVNIVNLSFNPSELSVASGSEVTFVNNDTVSHTVTADDGSFNSGTIGKGETWKHVFNNAGTFNYHCEIHPQMKAKIIVK